MALTLDHPEVDKLARELSHYTGENVTQVVLTALRERLETRKRKTWSNPIPKRRACLRIGQRMCRITSPRSTDTGRNNRVQ